MSKSTLHAIAQRLLALAGLALLSAPVWVDDLSFIPPAAQVAGLLLLVTGALSAFGIGPWGRHSAALALADMAAWLNAQEAKRKANGTDAGP